MTTQTNRSQSGFTLVELAVVMIIIGLLIGGVLKGQELINNAQVTSTVAQVKGIEAAVSTFRDTYSALPGDILTPATRLPNCGAAGGCNSAGDGNGRLANSVGVTPVGTEGARFFVHLNAADLLTGIVPGTNVPGENFPEAKIRGNAIQAGDVAAVGNLTGATFSAGASSGLYLAISQPAGATITAPQGAGLRPSEAQRIDTKLDDGMPGTGSARGIGGGAGGATDCASAATAAGTYNTAQSASNCGLYVRIQG